MTADRRKLNAICPKCSGPMDRRSIVCKTCHFLSVHGPGHWNWKGGRSTSKDGYVSVTNEDTYGHPRNRKNRVFEHIIVMEKHLGRYLLPGETVHHKNLQRADNRLENLELWTSHQPKGARVEDMVAWARETLKQYANFPSDGEARDC